MPNFPRFHGSIFIFSSLLLLASTAIILAQRLPPPFLPHPHHNAHHNRNPMVPTPAVLSNTDAKINTPLPPNPNIYHDDQSKSQQPVNNQQKIFNKSMARQFVDAHNVARLQFRHPFLIWDKNLAKYAKKWSKKRVDDCKMIHSYGPYGENIFWGGRDHWTPKEAVEYWMEEKEYYNPSTNECAPQQMCGHYTQVIWKNTARVGCSRTRCSNGGLLIFCEYDPPGNYVNENPFGKVLSTLVDLGITATTSVMPTLAVPNPISGQPQNGTLIMPNPMSGQTQTGVTPAIPSLVPIQPQNVVGQAHNGATQLIPNQVLVQTPNGGIPSMANPLSRKLQNGGTFAMPNQVPGRQQNDTPSTKAKNTRNTQPHSMSGIQKSPSMRATEA